MHYSVSSGSTDGQLIRQLDLPEDKGTVPLHDMAKPREHSICVCTVLAAYSFHSCVGGYTLKLEVSLPRVLSRAKSPDAAP